MNTRVSSFARIVVPTLIVGVGFGALAFSQMGGKKFPDIEEGSYYQTGVQEMNRLGVIQGYSNGNFGPGDTVNRAQMATILHRFNENVVLPLRWQMERLHKMARLELQGQPWVAYEEKFMNLPVEFSAGGEGEPGYEASVDYYGSPPSDWVLSYDQTTELFEENFYGTRIYTQGKLLPKGMSQHFYIWINWEIGLQGVYGFFYDDVSRLIEEMKGPKID